MNGWIELWTRGLRVLACAGVFCLASAPALAQDDEDEETDVEEVEEVTVTGTQIKGARISDALAVSVIDAQDIEALGIESGDELMDLIPESGQNFFSEAENISGGVNSARGDVGAFNLRNLGTGNTLVLLNGRRLVNSATFQTEEIGGSFVPVNSVNANHIPVFGVERLEVLRDGASAIYGADAVAGVVNTVLKDDFEGFTLRVRHTEFDNLPRDDQAVAFEWGKALNGGRTHVGLFGRHYRRDRVNSQDDPRWADADFRSRFDPSSPYATSTVFRNDSANSLFGQFDVVRSLSSSHSLRQNDVTDNAGEFEIFPLGSPQCANGFDLGNGSTCLAEDGQGVIRYNLNANRDLVSEMDRTTIYGYLNHDLAGGSEFFSDFYYYESSSNLLRHPSTPLTAVRLRVGAQNYYNPLGPCGSPNRLPDSIIGTDVPCEGLELQIDNYRFAELPRIVDNDGDSFRILAGLRGNFGAWDWETAAVYSEASREDVTHNRLSNTLITQALFDPTPAAYNPFSGGVDTNIERALVDVSRTGETTLRMFDYKLSRPNIYDLPAGPIGLLVGYELRREEFKDDRDPRLDGTIRFTDFDGDTYPLTSDVVNSSPTPDNAGGRTTNSLFAELQIPLHEKLDLQAAVRYEDFSDVGETTVGKLAAGWRPVDKLLVRGSISTAFRAPNLITINEAFVARSNTRDDWVCQYAVDNGSLADDTFSDCDYGMQRQASGSKSLEAEESLNTSLGFVFEPFENLVLTFDYWTIEKDDTIGLFGEENHVLVDLVTRLAAGTSDCANVQGHPNVQREAPTTDPDEVQGFLDAGLCPVGQVTAVAEQYENLDTRTIEGFDVGVYYDVDTSVGTFSFKYNGAFYEEFEQKGTGGLSAAVIDAKEANPAIVYPLVGIGNLKGINGNQDSRMSASLNWRYKNWGAALTGFRISDFVQVLSNGDDFKIPSMTTYNASVDYGFDVANVDARVRFGIVNLTDERAPIADRFFGYFADAHRDTGRQLYLDLRLGL